MRFLFSLIFFSTFEFTFSQNIKSADTCVPLFITKKATDCKDAILLNIDKYFAFNYITPPKGFGIQEIISGNQNDKIFEKEHNSTWFLLSIKNDGELIFEITPIDSTNDYDFLLYSYTDSSFCNDLLNKKINPIRGNLIIPSSKSGNKTGLSSKAVANVTKKTVGTPFSKSINVKADEKYMLIVDNVTPNGKGYGISFSCVNELIVSGKINDVSKKPIKAIVTLLDRNNNKIAESTTSSNGTYQIKAEIKEAIDYSLLFYCDSCLPQSAIINTSMIERGMDSLIIDETMLKLKVGGTYNLLNFSRTSILLNIEGVPVLGLAQLMKKYPKMRIQIQGHAAKYEFTKNQTQTNGGSKIDQIIAEERADAVYFKLIQNGIQKERMEKIGLSSDKPLIANPSTEDQRNKNKRVSIKILSL